MVILILFFCSGATALVYEVLWSKYLSLMLGSTVQAQTVVLAVFMGGLAIGNKLFGNRADKLKAPLSTYGYLEISIGLFSFFFYQLYQAADFVFVKVGSAVSEWSGLLLLLKLFMSFILLIGPTILMGGTLPLLASWIRKRPGLDWASQVSLFYAINSLGAVTGATLAGFVLVQSLGMVSSLQVVALVNAVIGATAVILSKREITLSATPAEIPAERPPISREMKWLCLLVAVTGGVSMGLEVVTSRSMALVVGGSLQAFALVLMSFIFGIGIGSLFISSSKIAKRLGIHTIYFLLLGAAVLVGLNIVLIEKWVIFYSQAKFGLSANATGYIWHQVFVGVLAFGVLGLPAAFLGATVPLAITLVDSSLQAAAIHVGRLLTWNTVGAVAGTLITGFALMPVLGIRGAFAALIFVLLAVVAGMGLKRQHRAATFSAGAIAVLLAAGLIFTGEHWRLVLGAGVFRLRSGPMTAAHVRGLLQDTELLYYKDGPDATVSVENGKGIHERAQTLLRINGKADASSFGDLSTQYLLAHLPMMANPDAKQVFVLGFGSGITAGALLGHPIERLTIAENCQPVLEAAPFFGQWNRGVLTNSRTTVKNEDARAVLKLSRQKYDVIISEPSNPWVVGVGSVFSKDFYELAASKLADGGIMAQWFHTYEMDDPIVYLVIRTFGSVFPNLEIWDTQNGDIVLLGAKKPWPSNAAQFGKLFQRPIPREDLEKINMTSPEKLFVRQVASQRTAFAIAGDGPVQTDEFPILEYAAPKAFFIGKTATELCLFDERTWESSLAPAEKIKVLQSLSPEEVVQIFQPWGTSNSDLNKYRSYLQEDGGTMTAEEARTPIAFRRPESYPEKVSLAKNASEEFKRLTEIELAVLRNPAQAREQLPAIEEILNGLIAEKKLKVDFSPHFYAALGARIAMRDGDFVQAERLVHLGLAFAPEAEQLNFLSRILTRVMPPEMQTKSEKTDLPAGRAISRNP